MKVKEMMTIFVDSRDEFTEVKSNLNNAQIPWMYVQGQKGKGVYLIGHHFKKEVEILFDVYKDPFHISLSSKKSDKESCVSIKSMLTHIIKRGEDGEKCETTDN